MNERIRQLSLKAGGRRDYEKYHKQPWNFSESELDKFAELIVKECMEMATELEARYLASRKSTMDFDEKNIYAEGEAACDILRFKMKQHFGVEE